MIQIGNGNWAVKEDNLLGFRYDETEGVYFPREMTFGRACDATRVNPDGLIERVPYNLLQQSNTFNTTWLWSGVTATSGQSDKDGGTTAWRIDKTTSDGYVYQNLTASGQFTFGVYIKAGSVNWVRLHITAGSTMYQYFDLINGVLGSGNNTSASMTDVGNGWWLCKMTFTDSAVTRVRIYPAINNNDVSGTSGNIYIQDAQLNEGSLKPYFPTTNRQDIARIDYSSGTGALLLEPQRTNLVTYSEQFDNGVWSKVRSSISANVVTSPDGTQNADKLIEDTTASASHFVRGGTYSFTSGTTYTITIYAKSSERQIGFNTDASVGAVSPCLFDLVDGTIQSNGNFTTSINLVGNGWYRCVGTFTATATATAYVYFRMGLNDSTAYTGDGTSGVYLWGAQLEASSYPTSYIPTTSATVTRLADTCYKTGVADWIGQTEGVLFGEFYVPQIITAGSYVRTIINDGTSLNQIAFFYYPDGRIQAISSVGGSIVVSFNIPLFGLTAGTHKFAFGYKLNDYVLFVDGVNVGSDTSATVPSMSVLNLYDTSGGSMYYKHATIYKTRLSNSELAALTTI